MGTGARLRVAPRRLWPCGQRNQGGQALGCRSEVARALRYDRVKRRYQLSEEDIRAVIALLWTQGEVVPDPLEVQPLTADSADDLVLAVCLDGKADYLVTGDSVLLALATHRSTRIVTPRAFLTTLAGADVILRAQRVS